MTHWGFALSNTVVALLQYWLLSDDYGYREIQLYQPLDVDSGTVHVLVPVPPESFNEFDPEKYRDNEVLNLNPSKFKLVR